MKQLKRHCLMMLLLATLWMTAACGRDNGATNDSNDNANSGAGVDVAGEAETGTGHESMEMAFTTIRMWTGTGFWKRSEEMPMTWWMI